MAHNKAKAVGDFAESAKESAKIRAQRIDGSQNGATLRTRIVRDKTKYSRTLKHKKSLADAGDFPYVPLGRGPVGTLPSCYKFFFLVLSMYARILVCSAAIRKGFAEVSKCWDSSFQKSLDSHLRTFKTLYKSKEFGVFSPRSHFPRVTRLIPASWAMKSWDRPSFSLAFFNK